MAVIMARSTRPIIGMGFMTDDKTAHGRKLPNIEDPQYVISKPSQRPPAAGFCFVSPAWGDRPKHTGTCNEAWQRHHFPLSPADFDLRFHNAAAPGLTADGYLHGGEEVCLMNLSPKGTVEFLLPALHFNLTYRLFKVKQRTAARIWTVCIEPDDGRFYLTWGASIETHGPEGKLRTVLLELDH